MEKDLLKYCRYYHGEKENPNPLKRRRLGGGWNQEKASLKWILKVVSATNIKLNFDFFTKNKMSIWDIESYLSRAVPNIPYDIRNERSPSPMNDGEDFTVAFFGLADNEWEEYRKKLLHIPIGGITINRK